MRKQIGGTSMVGDKLINLFYTSATDDKMVMLIDELGLEQPVMD